MKRAPLLLALVLLACCGERQAPLPAVDLQIRLVAGARTVRPGEGFTLDVVRTWRKELDPSPWDDGMLSPLVVREDAVERRADGRRIQETRRLRAYAFSLGDVRVPAVPFAGRPKDGGELRIAAAKPLRLRVEPELDPADPGAPELPGGLPEEDAAWPLWLALLAGLALGGLLAWRRRLARSVHAERLPSEPEIPAEVRAQEALARIRAQEAPDPVADAEAVACVVRSFVAERFGLAADRRTTEELAVVPGVEPVLARCDRVKFGAQVPTLAQRASLLDVAEAFVRGAAS